MYEVRLKECLALERFSSITEGRLSALESSSCRYNTQVENKIES